MRSHGNERGASHLRVQVGLVVGALLLPGLLLGLDKAAAQTPGPGGQPPLPPPEVINCVRPSQERIVSDLVAPESFAVSVDSRTRKAQMVVRNLPSNATCYVILKDPSGSNPIAQGWDATRVMDPGELTDNGGFPSAGQYCYQLIVGNRDGRSKAVERCVDVPTSLAPAPTPAATPGTTPPPPAAPGFPPLAGSTPQAPGTGSGSYNVGEEPATRWILGGATSLVAALAAAPLLVARVRRSR